MKESVDVALIHSTPVLRCGKVKTGLLWPLAVPGQVQIEPARTLLPGNNINILRGERGEEMCSLRHSAGEFDWS